MSEGMADFITYLLISEGTAAFGVMVIENSNLPISVLLLLPPYIKYL